MHCQALHPSTTPHGPHTVSLSCAPHHHCAPPGGPLATAGPRPYHFRPGPAHSQCSAVQHHTAPHTTRCTTPRWLSSPGLPHHRLYCSTGETRALQPAAWAGWLSHQTLQAGQSGRSSISTSDATFVSLLTVTHAPRLTVKSGTTWSLPPAGPVLKPDTLC